MKYCILTKPNHGPLPRYCHKVLRFGARILPSPGGKVVGVKSVVIYKLSKLGQNVTTHLTE